MYVRVYSFQCISNSIDVVLLSRSFEKYAFEYFFRKIVFAGKHKPETHFTFDYPFSYRTFSIILALTAEVCEWYNKYSA